MAKEPYGVGIIGAGPGVQALHVPTIARLGGGFRIVHVSDAGSGRAAAIAASLDARSSEGISDLLRDRDVEVVAICSPPEHHAAQILTAIQTGVRAILCEKPIGTTHEEVDTVIDACRATGTALVVGTNHVFDPAWSRAKRHLLAHGGRVEAISASLALPPNGRYHEVVSEAAPASGQSSRPAPDWNDPDFAAAVIRSLILGLAIHDLPLVRDLAPRLDRVVFARPVPPIGYAVGFVASGVAVSLNAVMLPEGADAMWRLRILTDADEVEVDFPPAFVHEGSATVRVLDPTGALTSHAREATDGYVAEWQALAASLSGDLPPEYEEVRADGHFAVELADAAAAWIREEAAR